MLCVCQYVCHCELTTRLPPPVCMMLGTEVLFQPAMLGREVRGIPRTVFDAIHKTDCDIRDDLYANVVLSGGNTLFPAFAERLHEELVALAPTGAPIKVIALPGRKHSAWSGGSCLARPAKPSPSPETVPGLPHVPLYRVGTGPAFVPG